MNSFENSTSNLLEDSLSSSSSLLDNPFLDLNEFFNYQYNQYIIDSRRQRVQPISKEEEIRKRGRKKNSLNGLKRPEHGKLARDNIKRKLQIHYLNFLRNLVNQIIYEINYEYKNVRYYQFYPLKHSFSKNITKKHLESLKKTNIGDIFKVNTSTKFKEHEKLNRDVYEEVKKNDIVKNILNKKYLEFIDYYYYNLKQINLSEYGIDKIITLDPSLEFYEDLINRECQGNDSEINNSNMYRQKLEQCIKKDFLNERKFKSKPLFVVKKNTKGIINY